MERIAQHNSLKQAGSRTKGFSLVEMMIALSILTVAILGLLDLTITSIRVNLQNDMRNTAVRLTSQTAEMFLVQPMNSQAISAAQCPVGFPCSLSPYSSTNAALADPNALNGNYYQYYPNPVQNVRGTTQTYTVTWTVTDLTYDLKEISITVSYTFRNQTYTNTAVVHKHRAV